jgi:IS5 family transposase
VGGLRRSRYRGPERVQMHAYLVAAAYNPIRVAKLSTAPA